MAAKDWVVKKGQSDYSVISKNRNTQPSGSKSKKTKTVYYAQDGEVKSVQVAAGESEVGAVIQARAQNTNTYTYKDQQYKTEKDAVLAAQLDMTKNIYESSTPEVKQQIDTQFGGRVTTSTGAATGGELLYGATQLPAEQPPQYKQPNYQAGIVSPQGVLDERSAFLNQELEKQRASSMSMDLSSGFVPGTTILKPEYIEATAPSGGKLGTQGTQPRSGFLDLTQMDFSAGFVPGTTILKPEYLEQSRPGSDTIMPKSDSGGGIFDTTSSGLQDWYATSGGGTKKAEAYAQQAELEVTRAQGGTILPDVIKAKELNFQAQSKETLKETAVAGAFLVAYPSVKFTQGLKETTWDLGVGMAKDPFGTGWQIVTSPYRIPGYLAETGKNIWADPLGGTARFGGQLYGSKLTVDAGVWGAKTGFKALKLSPKLWPSRMLNDKTAKIGGRSARERAGVMTKAAKSKASRNQYYNPKIFFDNGQIGVKRMMPRDTWLRMRTIRFDKGGRVVQTTDFGIAPNRYGLTSKGNFNFIEKGTRMLKIRKAGSQSLAPYRQQLKAFYEGRTGQYMIVVQRTGRPIKSIFPKRVASPKQQPVLPKYDNRPVQLLPQEETPGIIVPKSFAEAKRVERPGWRPGTWQRYEERGMPSFDRAAPDLAGKGMGALGKKRIKPVFYEEGYVGVRPGADYSMFKIRQPELTGQVKLGEPVKIVDAQYKVITEPRTLTGTTTGLGTRTRTLTGSRTSSIVGSGLATGLATGLSSALGLSQAQSQSYRQAQRYRQAQALRQRFDIPEIFRVPTVTGFTGSTYVGSTFNVPGSTGYRPPEPFDDYTPKPGVEIPPIVPIPLLFAPIPSLNFSKMFGRRGGSAGSFKPRYTASVEAALLNIRSKGRKSPYTSGLNLRPLGG